MRDYQVKTASLAVDCRLLERKLKKEERFWIATLKYLDPESGAICFRKHKTPSVGEALTFLFD